MAKRKFAESTRIDNRYTKKVDRPDKYTSFWGTRTDVNHRTTWSIKHARHPVIAWAGELKALAVKVGTPDEWMACQKVLDEVNELQDFTGVREWRLTIASQNVKARASILRL